MGLIMMVGASVGTAHASSLSPDFSRLHDHADPIVRQGDFDGDGRVDELYFSTRPNSQRVDVHVRLNAATGPKDIQITSIDMNDDVAVNVQVVPAGHYTPDCGNFASDCDQTPVVTTHDSLILAIGGGSNVLAHWQDDHFEQDFVRSDEALMAHVLSALYALNP
eukprot:gene17691-22370_t